MLYMVKDIQLLLHVAAASTDTTGGVNGIGLRADEWTLTIGSESVTVLYLQMLLSY